VGSPGKLNSQRLLERAGIPYEALPYDDRLHDAGEVARALGVPPDRVFKTLVVLPEAGPARPMLALVPADRQLDLKALASAASLKKVVMAQHASAERLTGLQVGGISPLALTHKRWRVFIDASAAAGPWLLVSAGQRGLQLRVAPHDLQVLLDAKIAPIART
jgi:Cys-tRNA(Pro)/Cys-tRNA(Cys) deacylase